jgi:hypothetical protein
VHIPIRLDFSKIIQHLFCMTNQMVAGRYYF